LLGICTKMWRSEADEWYSPNYRIDTTFENYLE